MHGSCSLYLITTILSVALDVSYIGITKSVVFSRWPIVRHIRPTNTGALWKCKYLRGGGLVAGIPNSAFIRMELKAKMID